MAIDVKTKTNRGLSTKQVAARLGCCERVAREQMVLCLPFYRVGKNLRVDSDVLEAWIKRGCGVRISPKSENSNNKNG